MRSKIRRTFFSLWPGITVLLLSTQLLAQPAVPPREKPADDFWRAWAKPGEKHLHLVVEGILSEGGLGVIATLKEATAVDKSTEVLLLKLEKKTLPGNWPLVIRPVPVRFESKSYQSGQFESVRIRYPDGESATIDKVFKLGRDDSTDPPEDQVAEPRLVTKILNVELSIETTAPPNLSIKVKGEVPTGGYRNPTLVRVNYVTPPEDGIQDVFLYATPPTGFATQAISQVTATDLWEGFSEEAPWLKGVRIHGAGKQVVVKKLC